MTKKALTGSHRKVKKKNRIKKLCSPQKWVPSPPPLPIILSVYLSILSIHPGVISPSVSVCVSHLPHSKLFSSLDLYLMLSEDCFACEFPKWLASDCGCISTDGGKGPGLFCFVWVFLPPSGAF